MDRWFTDNWRAIPTFNQTSEIISHHPISKTCFEKIIKKEKTKPIEDYSKSNDKLLLRNTTSVTFFIMNTNHSLA